MIVNGTLVEAKMCKFTLESTHDGANAKIRPNSHEPDYSVGEHEGVDTGVMSAAAAAVQRSQSPARSDRRGSSPFRGKLNVREPCLLVLTAVLVLAQPEAARTTTTGGRPHRRHPHHSSLLTPKKDRIKETLRFGRRNQMSSSNILSIHGLKKKHQFQDSNRDINGDCVHVTIMYIVYSITRRSSDSTVLDVWPAQPLRSRCPVKGEKFWAYLEVIQK